MASATTPFMPLSLREYLDLEESSSVRHEYVGGMLHALAGASRRHNLIIPNLITTLGPIADQRDCSVHDETVKFQVADDAIYYPDLMITCQPDDTNNFIVECPWVVVEVVSSSMRAIDRRVPSVQAYLIVEQDRPAVQRHWRAPDGAWLHGEVSDVGTVPIPCLDVEMMLDGIYRRIEFTAESS